ncbi:MAG TPA: hypothetical protein DDW49_03355 [Deltaproteobacteria bacterium]|nr:MAG: hypothetical protein A2048_08585 [Deltaproteobacteria bacterium GWA2_45_12]HBF12418.1 hypothetical protein [Deltaproteobacteria bacterium]
MKQNMPKNQSPITALIEAHRYAALFDQQLTRLKASTGQKKNMEKLTHEYVSRIKKISSKKEGELTKMVGLILKAAQDR